MKVLITGGAGCIGSSMAEALTLDGHDVVVFDNLSSGKMEHIQALLNHRNFQLIEGDILDGAALAAAMDGVDIVHHMAANPDIKYAPGDPTDKDLNQNTLGTYRVLEAMRVTGVRRLAFASTSAVYGLAGTKPIPEDAPFPRPISLYGATKLACEGLICAFQNLFEFQCWIFRFANIVGAKTRKRGRTVLGDFIARLRDDPTRLLILGDGKQAKSYLLNEECVGAMRFALEHAHAPLNIFNLGCDDWVTVDRIAELVVDAMGLSGVRFEYTGGEGGWPGDVPRFRLDVSAINGLGWRAAHNSEEAIRIAIQASLAGENTRCKP